MSLRKLNSKYNYYKVEAEIGSYHNPYDYHEEQRVVGVGGKDTRCRDGVLGYVI
jgi:hypothetical protein